MTEHIVKKAKEYDRDTVPGDYATLATPCPNCGGVVKENYRRYACTGKPGTGRRLRLLLRQVAGRPHLRGGRGRAAAARQADRPARRLPLQGRLALHLGDRPQVRRGGEELEARVRLRRRQERRDRRDRRLQRPGVAGPLPEVRRARVRARQQLRLREVGADRPRSRRRAATSRPARSSCSSRSSARRSRSCSPPARPTCSTSSSRCARAVRSRPSWPGTRKRAR